MAPFVPFSAYETLWPGTVHVWPSSVIFQYPIVSRGTGAISTQPNCCGGTCTCTCSALVLSCSRLKFRLNSLDRNSIETPTVRPKETRVPVVRDQLMEHSASRSGLWLYSTARSRTPRRPGTAFGMTGSTYHICSFRSGSQGALPGKPPIRGRQADRMGIPPISETVSALSRG
ncbi:hypothetical protein ACIPQA_31375 [Streptomyces sp. NPDC090109]|uniref:hypothetical protein n=1 Tax=Streptomyces sp. NPDC090109 TaxID=3365948 RepID=UPI0038256E90